ncbi:MAG: hypothetical protein QGG34_02450 [SAR202 cluster bacterium]|jgi:hypothetical protein|nr:hypothetical protein [SAR202 cluster bacterium]MDP6299776.1 hypothetical protein [SAR202 cluster bacterium]MDP7102321.1 hypothetical protein [SAR202 cluster bacterium]MDP7225485.1 hypothetical protein [SAR202 cluster bacterium]MDP7414156.1 hypothetical protein [SAR202 cluster bacterium]|tara:strand:+ start:1290 stop:1598 length:309 start_codon:yes stop_codon:yes gene_type:complete
MPDFQIVALNEAVTQTNLTGKRGEIVREYLGYIEQLRDGSAGVLHADEGETTAAIRRRLGSAAELAGQKLVVKRVGGAVYFWQENNKGKPSRRGRPRRSGKS